MPAVPTKDVAVVPEPKPEEDVLAWLKAYIPSDSFKRLPDWLKLAILGSILEAARRGVVFCWNFIQDACFLSVHFDGGDDSYGACSLSMTTECLLMVSCSCVQSG